MTVFMGTRTNYLVSRYGIHSKACWLALVLSLVFGGLAATERKTLIPVGITTAAALCTSNGRRTVNRGLTEVFYGCLFTFTGVFQTKGSDNRSTNR